MRVAAGNRIDFHFIAADGFSERAEIEVVVTIFSLDWA
jgi:hypothetical protein